jgi:hypothetical protein
VGFSSRLLSPKVSFSLAFSRLLSAGLILKTIINAHWDWKSISIVAGLYLLVGILWALFRWHRRAVNLVQEYNTIKDPSAFEFRNLQLRLNASDHKAQIMAWVTYWPWSLLWNFTGDIITALFDAVKNIFTSVSNQALKGATKPKD